MSTGRASGSQLYDSLDACYKMITIRYPANACSMKKSFKSSSKSTGATDNEGGASSSRDARVLTARRELRELIDARAAFSLIVPTTRTPGGEPITAHVTFDGEGDADRARSLAVVAGLSFGEPFRRGSQWVIPVIGNEPLAWFVAPAPD